jgi:glutamate racemase
MSAKNYASPPPVNHLPIGVFDSGVGGLTVLKALYKQFPHENFIYFGDTARLPYGGKSPQTIQRYSLENVLYLQEQGIKALVIACNTATAMAKEHLQEHFPFPIVDVISPTVAKALSETKTGHIAILGTKGTIRSNKIQEALLSHGRHLHLYPVFCPLFVPFIEEQMIHHPSMPLIIDEYLSHLKNTPIDTVILACTHYPLLIDLLQDYFGENISLIDSAEPTALELFHILQKHALLKSPEDTKNFHRFIVSDDPEHFQKHGRYFLGEMVDHVELVPHFNMVQA